MSTRKTNKTPSDKISARARQALRFAEERAAEAGDWVELHNALFGIRGKATELFETKAERTAFCRTLEYKRILALMDTLPTPDWHS